MHFPSIAIGTLQTRTGEVPSGLVNGANLVFILVHTPAPSSLHLFLNGVFQTEGIDYTLSGITITFTYAPSTGDSIYAKYSY
jgi:hypothetical protein